MRSIVNFHVKPGKYSQLFEVLKTIKKIVERAGGTLIVSREIFGPRTPETLSQLVNTRIGTRSRSCGCDTGREVPRKDARQCQSTSGSGWFGRIRGGCALKTSEGPRMGRAGLSSPSAPRAASPCAVRRRLTAGTGEGRSLCGAAFRGPPTLRADVC